MSGSNHTPGPWHETMYDGRVFVEPRGRSGTGEYICEVGLPSGDRVFEDARLIAAAPDLLAACEAAYHALRSYQYGNSATKLAEGVADEIAAAIAKARGAADETH